MKYAGRVEVLVADKPRLFTVTVDGFPVADVLPSGGVCFDSADQATIAEAFKKVVRRGRFERPDFPRRFVGGTR